MNEDEEYEIEEQLECSVCGQIECHVDCPNSQSPFSLFIKDGFD